MKSFQEIREAKDVEEARQMKDPKKDTMVVKNGKILVIDKSKEKEYLKKGWTLAETTESESIDEGLGNDPPMVQDQLSKAKAALKQAKSALINASGKHASAATKKKAKTAVKHVDQATASI